MHTRSLMSVATACFLLPLGIATAQPATTSPPRRVITTATAASTTAQELTGVRAVEGSLGQAGMTLKLRGGMQVVFPANLPVGSARAVSLKVAKAVKSADVHPSFARVGETVTLSAAINATEHPLLVQLPLLRIAPVAGKRLVLAVEQLGICDAEHTKVLQPGLCSVWTVVEAKYNEETYMIEAELPNPGGFRLQFGWLSSDVTL